MKKILILFLMFLGLSANAQTIDGGVDFEWVSKSQIQRDQNIEYVKSIVFAENSKSFTKKEFKQEFLEFLKDKNSKQNYIQITSGVTEDENAKYSGFFLKNRKLYMYAIQYKDNPKNVYYYDALGGLRYVDVISDNYPNYPYYSSQYRVNGSLVSKIYFSNHFDQYMYNPDGSFKGRWFKENMYDKNAKIILRRSNY